MQRLIINTEFFLQCNGSCSGCFLTEDERLSENTFIEEIRSGLNIIAAKYKDKTIPFLVIGFGRGNILNLNKNGIDSLLELITWCKENFQYERIIFEVSTSLIGKIENQISMAKYIVEREEGAYFNMVLNSELSSKTFWKNVALFHRELSEFRTNLYKIVDGNSDILVLNVNPQKLPDIEVLKDFTKDYFSPINISIFPFDKTIGKVITEKEINEMTKWGENIWINFKDKDLNIKNFLNGLGEVNLENKLSEYIQYNKETINAYIFIDKTGKITEGTLSIMGEVDKVRLLEKFDIDISIETGLKTMLKNKTCRDCEYQKKCLLSGAYLNLMANTKNVFLEKKSGCLSGYKEIFRLESEQ